MKKNKQHIKDVFVLLFFITAFSAKGDYWTQKTSFPGAGLAYPFSFSIGNKGYVGCGLDGLSNYHNDFWEYDVLTNGWTQKGNFGGSARVFATGFSIGNKGYAGLGANGSVLQDFWEYDPVSNAWTQKANFGGGISDRAIGFSIGNMGYMGIGWGGNELWQYNPVTNIWTQKAYLPATLRQAANCFVIGNNGYIVGGDSSGIFLSDLWEYNSISDNWSQKANFPAGGRGIAAAFSICDKGYYGTGQYAIAPYFAADWWQYDPVTNAWIQKANFQSTGRDEPAYFSIGTKGYIGLGAGNNFTLYNDFWEYTPDSACATNLEELLIYNLQFTISPNPSKDFLIINYPLKNTNKKINLNIMDVSGKVILQTQPEIKGHQSSISIRDLVKGIYFAEASDPDGIGTGGKQKTVRKFVKE